MHNTGESDTVWNEVDALHLCRDGDMRRAGCGWGGRTIGWIMSLPVTANTMVGTRIRAAFAATTVERPGQSLI